MSEGKKKNLIAYTRLVGSGESLLSVEQMPKQVSLSFNVVRLAREMLESSKKHGRESSILLDCDEGNRALVSSRHLGSENGVNALMDIVRLFSGKTSYIEMHPHPTEKGDSSPSPDDVRNMLMFRGSAFGFLIASDASVSLMLQSQESLNAPGRIFRSMRFEDKALEVYRNAQLEIWKSKLIDDEFVFDSKNARSFARENIGLISNIYGRNIGSVLKEANLAYYRFEGNLQSTNTELVLNKMN